MKFLSGHLGYALRDEQLQRNLGGLLKYLAFLVAVIAVHSVLFHIIMFRWEGQEHSWLTGVYWTLTVMSTLGFGDITFTTDVGRAFSVLVLISGILLLLIVLPFAFIRYFYAPWLEARLRLRAPREVPGATRDHVILCEWDTVARGLSPRLTAEGIPHFVIVEEPTKATELYGEEVPVVRGEVDDVATYERMRAGACRMVLLNRDDMMNTNVALTVREVSPTTSLVALTEDEHAEDILELSGCHHVLLLKRRLGEHLANRVNAGHAMAHVIGRYRDLVIAEFSVHGTPLAGRTIANSKIREIAGVNVAGVSERGHMLAPAPGLVLGDTSLPLVAGSQQAIDRLNEFLHIYDTNWNPVVVVGGGKVGRAAARALKARSIPVHMVERDPDVAREAEGIPDKLVVGDAADLEVMKRVGVQGTPSVVLSTNDDATNIYLAAYCRRLNPEAHILSRITHDRNLSAIRRAGADLTLSFGTLGVEMVLALLRGRPPIILGEGVGFHDLDCPDSVAGTSLSESRIGSRTGLTVVGVAEDSRMVTDPGPDTILNPDTVLLVIGADAQVKKFRELYG